MLMEGEPHGKICFRTGIQKDAIQTITFLNTLADAPADAWDVSYNRKGGVLAWAVPSGNLYDLYIAAEGGVVAPENSGSLFGTWDGSGIPYSNLTDVHFNGNLDFSGVTDMNHLFYHCYALAQVDVSTLDTSSVTDMWAAFAGCGSLTELDLSGFDTSRVEKMSHLFSSCSRLTKLDVSSFDTSRVRDMESMFWNCSALKTLDLSSFDMSNVTKKGDMFKNCPAQVNW